MSDNFIRCFFWLKPKPTEFLTPSVVVLVLSNLMPFYGVFYFHWEVFPILLLFWIENVIVGVFNIFKMLTASPTVASMWVIKGFMIPFFCFHYGMFTLVHGIFVFGFFGGYFMAGAHFPDENAIFQSISDYRLGWAVLALLLSHNLSFAINYIGKGEYKPSQSPRSHGEQPYSRVVLMQVTLLLVMSLGSPVFAVLTLVLLKTFIDVRAHLREHKKYSVILTSK